MSTQAASRAGQLHFDFIRSRDVVLRPGAGLLTSDAGLLAVRQFDERIGCANIPPNPHPHRHANPPATRSAMNNPG